LRRHAGGSHEVFFINCHNYFSNCIAPTLYSGGESLVVYCDYANRKICEIPEAIVAAMKEL